MRVIAGLLFMAGMRRSEAQLGWPVGGIRGIVVDKITRMRAQYFRPTPPGLITVVLIVVGINAVNRVPAIGVLHAQTSWRSLVVAPEQRCSPYDADDYRYPQSVEDRIVADLGGVYGPYTGRWFASESDTDMEHMVARSEAHDSGLCAADLATRRRFATDLLNLTLAGPRVNRYVPAVLQRAGGGGR